jgi:Putative Actinobacterial Holin-X, holin superfamily III
MAIDPDGPDVFEPRVKADRSITALLSDLASETVLLVRQELALFKAELQEKFGRIGQGATALGAGVFIALSGWGVLLAAAVLGLATVLPAWLAALIIAILALAIGVVLIFVGKSRFDADSLMPRRTLRSLREDEAWLRERLR